MSNEYPECAKIDNLGDEHDHARYLLEWLFSEGGYILAAYNGNDDLMPVRHTCDQIIARYFDYDLHALEKERRCIFENHQQRIKDNDLSTIKKWLHIKGLELTDLDLEDGVTIDNLSQSDVSLIMEIVIEDRSRDMHDGINPEY